jgi:hypothetical protein
MEILRKNFPEAIPDNEEIYIAHLEGVINSVDELSAMQISKMDDRYHFRISPSIPKYIPILMEELIKYHNILNIRLNFSKSIKTSGTINFEIRLM